MTEATYRELAVAWARQDPNPVTSEYVQRLLDSTADGDGDDSNCQNTKKLQSLFVPGKRIGFGTAGLRAAMQPGPLGMNDLTVLQTAQGIIRYCESLNLPRKAVIAYDHRAQRDYNLSSHSFALMTALVFRQAGWEEESCLLEGFVMTPLVPFCMKQTQASVGIMITASHNPKQDAGYKVYWQDACQIRSPLDTEIAASIQHNLEPWVDYAQLLQELRLRRKHNANESSSCLGLSQSAEPYIDAYFAALSKSGLVVAPVEQKKNATKIPRFCYTAMHGVGHRFAVRAFQTFLPGLSSSSSFVSVQQQQEPNPDFPTVVFPNPEEKGALDLAQQVAAEHNCDIILANDPDADRLAVAERRRVYAAAENNNDNDNNNNNNRHDKWNVFTGDQIGTMLGLWLYQQYYAKQCSDNPQKPLIAMCASTVSSKLLAEIARVEGFHFEETLTGFKWIGSRLAALQNEQPPQEDKNNDDDDSQYCYYKPIFGYEEAIGFACGDVVFDKDGISALGVMSQLCVHVYAQGKTLTEHMQSIYDKYGEFVSNNGYYFLPQQSLAGDILQHMCQVLEIGGGGDDDASAEPSRRRQVGPYPVVSVRYLGEPGYDSTTEDRLPTLPTSNSSPMMTVRFENGCVAQFRASGTEPKFKYYIEMKGAPGVARDVVQKELMEMSDILLEELLQPTKNGLK